MKETLKLLTRLPFCGSRLSSLTLIHKIRTIVLLLLLCSVISFLNASESTNSEVPGPESGYIYSEWQPNDKVLALHMEYTYIPDKIQYNKGEVLNIKFEFKVDKESRGYVPNREYYITSVFVPGFKIHSKGNLYWKVVQTDIDTLNTITDDQSLAGKVTLKLIDYREQEKESSDNNGMTLKPWRTDTQKENVDLQGLPPVMSFDAYRVALSETGENSHKHNKKRFFYDQSCGYSFVGDAFKEFQKSRSKSKSESPSQKSGPFYTMQPAFSIVQPVGWLDIPCHVLKNSSIDIRLSDSDYFDLVNVSFDGNSYGCNVTVNPQDNNEYILTKNGKVVGSGVYFYRLVTNDYSKSCKMVLMK